jgi:hypothetical protein
MQLLWFVCHVDDCLLILRIRMAGEMVVDRGGEFSQWCAVKFLWAYGFVGLAIREDIGSGINFRYVLACDFVSLLLLLLTAMFPEKEHPEPNQKKNSDCTNYYPYDGACTET